MLCKENYSKHTRPYDVKLKKKYVHPSMGLIPAILYVIDSQEPKYEIGKNLKEQFGESLMQYSQYHGHGTS